MNIDYILMSRATSSYGVSVGTAMVLESIFEPTAIRIDDTRMAPVKVNIRQYTHHYFNVQTLVRNIINSVPTMSRDQLLKDSNGWKFVLDTLWTEFDIILSLYVDTGCTPVVYVPSYRDVAKNMDTFNDMSKLKGFKLNLAVLVEDITLAITKGKLETDMTMIVGKHQLPRSNTKTLITTHVALDLLNYKRITKLELLESHTGKLKTPKEFNSKYHKMGKNDMSIFPFQEKLLYVLGDDTYIGIQPLKIRQALYNIAVENKWTPFTSESKVMAGVVKDTQLKILFSVFSTKY